MFEVETMNLLLKCNEVKKAIYFKHPKESRRIIDYALTSLLIKAIKIPIRKSDFKNFQTKDFYIKPELSAFFTKENPKKIMQASLLEARLYEYLKNDIEMFLEFVQNELKGATNDIDFLKAHNEIIHSICSRKDLF